MPRISLKDLQRSGRLELDRSVPADDPLWAATGLTFGSPVRIVLTASATVSGQVLATGRAEARVVHECRRCLERVAESLEQPLEFLWSPPDLLSDWAAAEAEGDVRPLDPSADEIDVGEAVREELVLVTPKYALCTEDCRGLCPHCGASLNEEECDCTTGEPDPRWEVLRALNTT